MITPGNINFLLSLLLVTIGFTVGLCLLFLFVPQNKSSHNFLLAKHIMGTAYIFLGISLLAKMILLPLTGLNPNIVRIIILTLSSLLALSFTYSFITLIGIYVLNKQNLIKELIPIGCCSVGCIITLLTLPRYIFIIFFVAFMIYYLSFLTRYAWSFYHTFKEYKNQMDNYFSEQEWNRLKKIRFSFYYALIAGILAPVSIIYSQFISFKLFIIPFLIYFGYQLISYNIKFQIAEPASQKDTIPGAAGSLSFQEIEPAIEQWIRQKKYLQTGVTIEQMATELNTNRSYLSDCINNTKQQSFRKWINELRIEEAKRLLLEQPALPVSEIGHMVGFSDKSNFGRQFIKLTSVTPQNWRRIHLHQ